MKYISQNEMLAVLSRLFQGFSILASLKLIVLFYGGDAYGFITLCISLTAYLTMFDFGIISSLRTALPREYRRHGRAKSYELAKAELKKLIIIAGPLYATIYAIINYNEFIIILIRDTIIKNKEINEALIQTGLTTVIIYSAIMLLSNFTIALMSSQERQYKYYLYLIFGSIVQVALLYITTKTGLGMIIALPVMLLTPFLPILYIIITEFWPLTKVHRRKTQENKINHQSIKYFIIQTCGQIVNSLDIIIVAYYFTLKEVAVYSTLKLTIQVPHSIHASYILQTWPLLSAYNLVTEKYEIKKLIFQKITKSMAMSLFSSLVIVITLPKGMDLLTGGVILLPLDLTILFCVYLNIAVLGACLTILSYAFNFTTLLTALAPLSVITMIGASHIGIHYQAGLIPVIIASIIIQFFGIISGLVFYQRHLHNSNVTMWHCK